MRRLYRTTIAVTILSEEPIESGISLEEIANQIVDGDWSGSTSLFNTEILSGMEEIKEACQEQGTDVDFFFGEDDDRIWVEIRNNFVDNGMVYIDGYETGDDDEVGTCIARVDLGTKEVEYLDERAINDELVAESIADVFNHWEEYF